MKDPVTELAEKILLQQYLMLNAPYTDAQAEQMAKSAWLAARKFYEIRNTELDKIPTRIGF